MHDSFMGGRCFCPECAPPPTVSEVEALRSADARRERDEQLVAWLRLTPSEAETFLGYLEVYDIEQSTRQLTHARLDRDLVAFWLEYGEPDRPASSGSLTPPRIYAPRIYAPRAA